MLRSGDESVRGNAFGQIHRMGPEAIPLLTELLRDRRVSVRRAAVDLLVDLAPDTEAIQSDLCRALKDDDEMVARDAARALGALGPRAAPSVSKLIEALSHGDAHVRLYSAEALASIGPTAAPAMTDLIKLLDDGHAGVRWAACEALAGIGSAATPAVPRLIEALNDEFLYVRLCAAGALGSIGPDALAAVKPLRESAGDPAMRAEALWALRRITREDSLPATTAPVATVRPSAPTKAPVISGDPPIDWDLSTGRNIAWDVDLAGETFGRPVVSNGVVYIGSDNAAKFDPAMTDACGALLAFRASDGAFVWQDLAPRVKRGTGEFLLPSTTSAPYIEGDRLYYVTAECQLRCLDLRVARDRTSSTIVWELDMCQRLGVFPHEACNSEVLPVGNLLIVCTSNGRNEGHTRVPSPRAPSLIAVDKQNGEVVWQAIGAGGNVLHGQWSSPIAANVVGRTQVLFGGGDGWLRAYDPANGHEIWRFDGNPKDARWLPRPNALSRSPIVASPVFDGERVYIAMGDDPSHGNGPSLLHAISPNGEGDVTESRLWTCSEIGRVVGTPMVHDGLIYVGDLGGRISCIDGATGAVVWKHETEASIWGCVTLAAGRVYVGNTDGVMTVLRAGRSKQVLAQMETGAALYSRPAIVGDEMYVATARGLYRIAKRP
jgi:outer membrane protein assembly factor BamB